MFINKYNVINKVYLLSNPISFLVGYNNRIFQEKHFMLLPNFFYISSWSPIVSYIDEQYEAYLRDESGLNRRNIIDNRVHCCLYFINPVGHG